MIAGINHQEYKAKVLMGRTLIVCVTGAAGRIAYSLYNTLCSSDVFGHDIDIITQKIPQLEIVKLELEDSCYQRVKNIELYNNKQQEQAFKEADVVIFLGSKPRCPGMDRWEVIQKNAEIFKQHGENLDKYAKKTCKSLVVSNPPNTNCLVLATNAPTIPKQNFTSLTRLDYNRFLNHVSEMFSCKTKDVKNLIIWGNHSKNHFCDINFVEIDSVPQQAIKEKLVNWDSMAVQKKLHERGGFIADKMNSGAYLSAAKSIIDHLRDWFMGQNKRVSMGVILPKSAYGIPQGVCFSLPVVCLGEGNFQIIDNLPLNENQMSRLLDSQHELNTERQNVYKYLVSEQQEAEDTSPQ